MGDTNRGQLDLGSDTGNSPIKDDIGTSDMNWGGKAPISFIQFILGDDIFNLFGDKMLNEAFENAFIEVSDLIVDDNILENLTESSNWNTAVQATYGGTNFIDNYPKRILKVIRQNTTDEDSDGSEQYYYNARKIPNLDSQAINPHSIYYENDPFNPAWFISITGGIYIIPRDSSAYPTGKVYYMSYPKFGVGIEINSNQTHDLGQRLGLQNFSLVSSDTEDEIFFGVPIDARKAVYYSMALSLVDGYLSNFVQEDEDMELITLLKAQSESFVFTKTTEMKKVGMKYGNFKEDTGK
jgi:hypothetical protein